MGNFWKFRGRLVAALHHGASAQGLSGAFSLPILRLIPPASRIPVMFVLLIGINLSENRRKVKMFILN